MTDETPRAPLYRRSILVGGLVLPLTFVVGAEAAPLAPLAYDDHNISSDSAQAALPETTAQPTLEPTAEAAVAMPTVPAVVSADPQYQALATEYRNAARAELIAVARHDTARAAWNAARSDATVAPPVLTSAFAGATRARHAMVYAREQARTAHERLAARAQTVIAGA